MLCFGLAVEVLVFILLILNHRILDLLGYLFVVCRLKINQRHHSFWQLDLALFSLHPLGWWTSCYLVQLVQQAFSAFNYWPWILEFVIIILDHYSQDQQRIFLDFRMFSCFFMSKFLSRLTHFLIFFDNSQHYLQARGILELVSFET